MKPTERTDRNRNLLFWSVSGKTLVSSVCDMESCDVDVIDASSDRARRLTRDFAPVSGSDRWLLGYVAGHGGSNHEASRPWQIYDLSTDTIATVAGDDIDRTGDGFVVDDSHAFVGGVGPGGDTYNVDSVQLDSGQATRLIGGPDTAAALYLRSDLVNPSYFLVKPREVDPFSGDGPVLLDVFDVAKSRVAPDAATVRPGRP